MIFYTVISCIAICAQSQEFAPAPPCPLWHHRDRDTGQCVCGSDVNRVVKCNPITHDISIRFCFCMTLDEITMKTVVAPCLYSCIYGRSRDNIMYKLNDIFDVNSTLDINKVTCGRFNRRGVLCSRCIEGYGLPAYSYNLSCVPCRRYKYNWLRYIIVVYFPLTVFVILIILFRFSANSGRMSVYITVSQLIASRGFLLLFILLNPNNTSNFFIALYSFWNLDFFHSLHSDFCLHPDLSGLQIVMLDYLAALYPLLLIILVYMVVHVQGRSRLCARLCQPLHCCLHSFRKEWNIQHSLIEAFASLIMLSFTKILHLTLQILSFVYHYDMTSHRSHALVLLNPSLEYFSMEHLPSVLVAFSASFVFNFLPVLLLCLYPYKCVQRFLSISGLNSPALRILMDAFQGCYKFKPSYSRSFSVVGYICNFLSLVVYLLLDYPLYFSGINFILIIWILLISLFLPYREKKHNQMNILLLIPMIVIHSGLIVLIENDTLGPIRFKEIEKITTYVMKIGGLFLPLYGFCHLLNYLIPSKLKKIMKKYISRCQEKWHSRRKACSDTLSNRSMNPHV